MEFELELKGPFWVEISSNGILLWMDRRSKGNSNHSIKWSHVVVNHATSTQHGIALIETSMACMVESVVFPVGSINFHHKRRRRRGELGLEHGPIDWCGRERFSLMIFYGLRHNLPLTDSTRHSISLSSCDHGEIQNMCEGVFIKARYSMVSNSWLGCKICIKRHQ